MGMQKLRDARLYGILDLGYVPDSEARAVARGLLDGGVQVLQLRAKGRNPAEILPLARELATTCRQAGVPFILNDYAELVASAGADGAHVGQEDISVADARAAAGAGAIIGKSTHSPAQARAAIDEKPDYIGFGPLFATPTKPDYAPIGTADIASVTASTPVPVFCIGGIKPDNLAGVIARGARRVVIVSGLLLAENIVETCRSCRKLLDAAE
jgi:thiamine-phosphate pyrophosphorylase